MQTALWTPRQKERIERARLDDVRALAQPYTYDVAYREMECAPIGGALALGRPPKILGGGFLPTAIAGCVLWLRADLGVTIGTGVSAWADQSGTGDANKNVTQATGSKQPTRITSNAAYNNQATLSFASASLQYLASGAWAASLSQPYTMFLVGNDGGAGGAFSDGPLGGVESGIFYVGGGTYRMYAGLDLLSGVADTSSPLAFCGLFNGASSSIFVSQKTANATGNAGAAALAGQTIGALNPPSTYLNGNIAEAIVYNSNIGSTNRLSVWNYIQLRYAMGIGA